ncbi:MAG: PQQ-binding-like beta-propeller repeat protein [Armatimonadota bacterium]
MPRRSSPLRLLRLTAGVAGAMLLAAAAGAEDWPQWRGPGRDGVWRETGLIEKFSAPQVPVKWRVPVSNGYSGPTVAAGRVYLTDRVTEPKQQERVHCFNAETGETLWTHVYDAAYGGVGYPDGPRAAVTVHDGRAYALGAVGHFHCLDAASGKLLWSHDLDARYQIRLPTWGLTAAPLIEGGLVILQIGGEGDACVVAFDRKTGQERWKALPDQASYSAPIIVEQAGKRVLVVWTGDRVVGLDPQTGTLLWAQDFPSREQVIAIATPALSGDRLFLTSFYQGSLMLRLPKDRLAVEKLWERRGRNELNTDGLHSIIATPLFQGDYVYGVDSYGELRCLDAQTGERLWESQEAVPKARWSTIHFVPNGDRVWLFNERGQLVIAKLSPKGYEEISRAQLIQPTLGQLPQRGGVTWSHPAYANKHVFARNDAELVCASLAAR